MDVLNYIRHQWDRVLAWVAIGGGALLLLLGWLGASNQVLPAGQIPYIISGGLGGVFLLGVGAVLWLSADLRDEWRQLHEIARQLGADDEGEPSSTGALDGPEEQASGNGTTRRGDRARARSAAVKDN